MFADQTKIERFEQQIKHLEQLIATQLEQQALYTSQSESMLKEINQISQTPTLEQLEVQFQKQLRNLRTKHDESISYLNKKIQNYEKTLDKYKQLFASFKNKEQSQASITLDNEESRQQILNSLQSFFQSECNSKSIDKKTTRNVQVQKNSCKSRQSSAANESVLSSRKTDNNKSINVVYELQCKTCRIFFKPHSYYEHLDSCFGSRMSPIPQKNPKNVKNRLKLNLNKVDQGLRGQNNANIRSLNISTMTEQINQCACQTQESFREDSFDQTYF